jgi:predicted ATPase
MTGRNVITAGPSAGKTSVIRELQARGYRTAPEAARIVIDQAVSEGTNVDELRSKRKFHAMVERQDRRIMRNLPESVFMDRSIIDNVAYRRFADNPVPDNLALDAESIEIENVFMLERIDYDEDYARTEDASDAQQIHELLRDVYREYGHDIVEIPLKPVDERADHILECVSDR